MKLITALFFALLCVGASADEDQCCFPGVCCVVNGLYTCVGTSTECFIGQKQMDGPKCGAGNNGRICAPPREDGETCKLTTRSASGKQISDSGLCKSKCCIDDICSSDCNMAMPPIVSGLLGLLCCIACCTGLWFVFRQKPRTTYVQVPNQNMMNRPAVAYAPPTVVQQQSPQVYGQQPQPGMYGQYGQPQVMPNQQHAIAQVLPKPNAHHQQEQVFHTSGVHQPVVAPQPQMQQPQMQQPQMQQPNIQTVTVPPGYGEGQKKKIIKLKFNGIEHKIKIPEGKGPGNTFDVNLDLLPRGK